MANKVNIRGININDSDLVDDYNDALQYHQSLINQNLMYNKNKYCVFNYGNKFTTAVSGINTIRVQSGQACLHGFNAEVTIATDIEVDNAVSGTSKGLVVIGLDRSETNYQPYLLAINGTSTTLPIISNDDILNNAGKFEMPICEYTIDTIGNITNIIPIDNTNTKNLNVITTNNITPDIYGNVDVVEYTFSQIGLDDSMMSNNNFQTYANSVLNALIQKSPLNLSRVKFNFTETENIFSALQGTLSLSGTWEPLTGDSYMAEFETTSFLNIFDDQLHITITDLRSNKKLFMFVYNGVLNPNLIKSDLGFYGNKLENILVGGTTNSGNMSLTKSALDFESLIIKATNTGGGIEYLEVSPVGSQNHCAKHNSFCSSDNGTNLQYFDNSFTGNLSPSGVTFSETAGAVNYFNERRTTIVVATGEIEIVRSGIWAIEVIQGKNRIFPVGTIHSLIAEDNKFYNVATYKEEELRRAEVTEEVYQKSMELEQKIQESKD